MTFDELLQFYSAHPPIEVGDPTKYLEVLRFASQITLLEYGQCRPVLDEKTFTTPAGEGRTVLYSLAKIHPNLIEILFISPKAEARTNIMQFLPSSVRYRYAQDLDIFSMILETEAVAILQEYATEKIKKLVYKGKYIKLAPATEYYVLFHRAPQVDELSTEDLLMLKELLEININLAVFGSDIFSGEMGIRSVSLSGLSVSFNVPNPETKIKSLETQKNKILERLCLTYDEGMIGLIY